MSSDENPEVDESLYVDETQNYKNCYEHALKILNKNIEDFTSSHSYGIVNIVPYSINKCGKYPFVEFILNKNRQLNEYGEMFVCLNFYRFFYTKKIDIFENSNKLLNASFGHVIKEGPIDFNKYYKGYVDDGNGYTYLFYDCTEINKDSTVTNLYNMWVTLPYEIKNKSSCDFPIDDTVVSFFINNSIFMHLTDENGFLYEIPEVGFTGSSFKTAEFRSVFSNVASNIDEIFGPYFYFTDYSHAVKDAREEKSQISNSIIKCGGLNRYALFKGNSISFYDYSDTDENSNSSGKDWTVQNDSIYIENLIALKKLEQHVPISYHLVV